MPNICNVGEAETFVREYVALVDEGWQPDMEEFVSRVPESLQEEVLVGIDAALANRDTEPLAESQPVAEEIVVHRTHPGRLLRLVGRAVPRDIRRHWLAELHGTLEVARECGLDRFEVFLLAAPEVLSGVAQHAPLQVGTLDPDNSAGRRTWWAWRAAGPLVFLGYVFESGWMLAAGGAALLFAFAMLVRFAREEPMPEMHLRTFNGVAGGFIVGIAVLVLPSAVTAATVMCALAFGQAWMTAAAVHVLTLLAVSSLCAITASGWVPSPWQPRRLVRV